MHIFLPCTSSFSSVRVRVKSCAVSHERRTLKRFVCFASRFCTFGFCILLCLQHLFSFFNRRTYSSGNNIFFLNLIKIECIVSELFKSSVKFVSANSFVCRFISPWLLFPNRFPLHIKKRENSVFPYFTSFPVNFLKDGLREKGRNST